LIEDKNYLAYMKTLYVPGRRIEIDFMGKDRYSCLKGVRGTVMSVDDYGTIYCDLDNGLHLGLVPGRDCFHTVKEDEMR